MLHFARVKNQLRNAIPVAQINEDHTTEIPDAMHPAGQCYVLPGIGHSQFTTCMCAVHLKVNRYELLVIGNFVWAKVG
jgi:hypothetical protein